MTQERIQVDYEQLEEIARRFGSQADEAGEWLQNIRRGIDRLRSGGWSGEGASAFFNEMEHEVLPGMDRLVRALDQSQSVAVQVSRAMEAAEREAAGLFQKDGAAAGDGSAGSADSTAESGNGAGASAGGMGGITGAVIGGRSGGATGSWGQVSKADYDWVEWRREMGEKSTNLVITAVGKKFKIAAEIITLLKTGVGIAFDQDVNTDLGRDVAGEIPKLLVKLGFHTLLTGPMLVSDIVQWVGHLSEGGLALAGFDDAASWLHDGLNNVDLNYHLENAGEYAFDELSRIPDRINESIENFKHDWEIAYPIIRWKFPDLLKPFDPLIYGVF